jgi:predicted amidohydrolase
MAFSLLIFLNHPPNADGKSYFAAPQSRSLAEEYHRYYKDGILEVTIDLKTYNRHFKALERPYQGEAQVELLIPHTLARLYPIRQRSTIG